MLCLWYKRLVGIVMNCPDLQVGEGKEINPEGFSPKYKPDYQTSSLL